MDVLPVVDVVTKRSGLEVSDRMLGEGSRREESYDIRPKLDGKVDGAGPGGFPDEVVRC